MRFPSRAPILSLLTVVILSLPALAQEPLVLSFDGTPAADGLPMPWKFERWAPMVGFGDYTAKVELSGS